LHWLEPIVLQHLLYVPNLTELNDQTDGLPRLAVMSEAEIIAFLVHQFVKNNPSMPLRELQHNEEVIRVNVRHHGPAALHPDMVKLLDSQLKGFRVYSMAKRYDMPNLWHWYGGAHRGYCLEFKNEGPLFEHAKEVSYLRTSDMVVRLTDPDVLDGRFLYCKTLDWSDEGEVRLVRALHSADRVLIKPAWLTRIILGKDIALSDEQQIRQWAEQRDPILTVAKAQFDPVDKSIKVSAT